MYIYIYNMQLQINSPVKNSRTVLELFWNKSSINVLHRFWNCSRTLNETKYFRTVLEQF